jgi:C-terminal processing protease CtpA/Prc
MRHVRTVVQLLITLLVSFVFTAAQVKDMSSEERNQVESMLIKVSSDLPRHYYDPKLHGVDWQGRVSLARDQIKQEKSLNMAMAHVAAALDSLNDSHTFLIPPRRPYVLDHGWAIQMIGEKCFVTNVRPNGDADIHGVKPGDQLLAINGYRIGRDNLRKIEYAFNVLRPLPQLTVTLRDPQGEERKAVLDAKFRQRVHMQNLDMNTIQNMQLDEEEWIGEQSIRTAEYGDDLLIAKLPSFMFGSGEVDQLISMGRKHKALILDLRQNPGGDVDMLKAVAGRLFDRDIKIYDRVGRDSTKLVLARSNHRPFDGKLFVLIDSKSASASELLARIVQLEKRGIVIGDRSSGSVMEARMYSYSAGLDMLMFYGASITDANLLMADGQSLEHVGVTPDEVSIATATDLASGRDPVLAHAAAMAGVRITPENAGRIFPYEWPRDK